MTASLVIQQSLLFKEEGLGGEASCPLLREWAVKTELFRRVPAASQSPKDLGQDSRTGALGVRASLRGG